MALELHTYVMMRLSRWSIFCLWRADLLTSKPGPRAVKSWWHPLITRPKMRVPEVVIVARKPCPVDEIECGATELCVQALPTKLYNAVIVGYLVPGTAEEKAAHLHCDRATYFRRLSRAYTELLGLFNDYEVGLVRVDVEQASAELSARRKELLTECDSHPKIRATLA